MTAAIDMWAPILPVPSLMAHASEHFPKEMLGYLRVFYKQQPTQDAFRQLAQGMVMSEEQVVAALDAADISQSLITGFDERGSVGETFVPNELVAPIVERYPDGFIPYAGVDVMGGMPAVREMTRWITERGFRGVSLRPFMIGLPADHRRCNAERLLQR